MSVQLHLRACHCSAEKAHKTVQPIQPVCKLPHMMPQLKDVLRVLWTAGCAGVAELAEAGLGEGPGGLKAAKELQLAKGGEVNKCEPIGLCHAAHCSTR